MHGPWSPGWAACLIAAALGAGAGAADLFPRGLAPVDAGLPVATRDTLSAKSCRGCHTEAHADWAASRIAQVQGKAPH